MSKSNFEWDEAKNIENQQKHGVSFNDAQFAFMDEKRVIAEDLIHSQEENRYYCFGLDQDKTGILTVRFTGSFEFQVGKQLAFTLEKSSFPVNK